MLSIMPVGRLAVPGVVHEVNLQLSRLLFVTLAMASWRGRWLLIICSGMLVLVLVVIGRGVRG